MALLSKTRSLLMRLMPKTLTSRLTFTVLLAILTVLVTGVSLYRIGDLLRLPVLQDPVYIDSLFARHMELVSLFSLFLAVSVSVIFGLYLSTAIGSSIERLATRLREQAQTASEGQHFTLLHVDDDLPHEFKDLLGAFNMMVISLEQHENAVARAMNDLAEAKSSLEMTFEQSAEGMLLVEQGKIELMNPSAVAHFGLSPKGLLGEELVSVFATADLRDSQERPLNPTEAFAPGEGESTLVVVRQSGRSPRWLKVTVRRIDGFPDRLLVNTSDITEEMRIDSLRTEVISLVSHDLRAPLTAISGYLEILSSAPPAPVAEKVIAGAQRSTEVMQDLLENLLHTARAEEMLAPSVMLPVDLKELAGDVCASLEHTSKHRLTVDAVGTCVVLGEDRRLRQVLNNLVTNAQKHSPPHTTISLTARCGGGWVTLGVEDEGPGVSDENRNLIFERFAKIPGDGQRSGVGLGLYIVRTVVEAHGGSVWVERGQRAGGALFVIRLPAALRCS